MYLVIRLYALSYVNICALATYCTDYIMVKRERLDDAVKAFKNAGYHIKYERAGSHSIAPFLWL